MGRLQIMFMSMGEPMLNAKALAPALRELHRLFPTAALLISTSAPRVDYAWIRALSVEIPTIGLQFSVQEWMRTHPGQARPTVGAGSAPVHAPRPSQVSE